MTDANQFELTCCAPSSTSSKGHIDLSARFGVSEQKDPFPSLAASSRDCFFEARRWTLAGGVGLCACPCMVVLRTFHNIDPG